VDAETRRQLGELDELRNAHKARLQILEVQAARAGNSTPPEVVTEIGDIKAKLVPIDAAIFKLTYVGHVRADVPGNERGDQVGYAVERTLERERRAMVARQADVELLTEVRLTAAMEAMQSRLLAAQRMALAALLLAVALATFVLSRGGL
jgi:hypothetical protein